MSDAWFVGRNGARSGPFTTAQLREMVSSGRLAAGDLVWREGMAAWAPCSTIPGLLGGPPLGPPENPYAPPVSSTEFDVRSGSRAVATGSGGRTYSFGNAFDVATKTFSAHWGQLVLASLATLAGFVLVAVPQWTMQIIGVASGDRDVMNAATMLGGCVGWIVNLLVGGHLFAGFVLAGANTVAGRPQIADVLVGFKRYGRVLLAYMLTVLCFLGVLVVAYVPFIACVVLAAIFGNQNENAFAILVGLGGLVSLPLLVAGMVLVGVRVLFTSMIVADPHLGSMGVMEALRLNWATVTPGRAVSLFGFMLVVVVLMTLSLLLLCIPYLLVGMPFMLAAYGAAYALLFRGPDDRAPVAG